MEYKFYNANPFKKRTNDCVTRSLVLGTRYGYKTICDLLGATFINGIGAQGVSVKQLIKFSEKTNLISNYDYELKNDWNITQRDIVNFTNYNGMTVRFWLEHLEKSDTGSAHVIFLSKLKLDEAIPGGTETRFHAIYGNLMTKEIYDIEDTSDTIVFDMYVVDTSKICKKEDERYFTTEAKKLKEENAEYLKSIQQKS